MANRMELQAETRSMLGKKVKRLRRAGVLPATIYGHNVTPRSIQFKATDLRPILRDGTAQLIDLVIDAAPAVPVLMKKISIDAKRNSVLHVEFFQANLLEKVQSSMPLHAVGDAPAVKDGGILLNVLDHVTIESLPQDVPAHGIEVDLSGLTEMNAQINAGDLVLPDGVVLVTPPDETVIKIDAPISEAAVDESLAVETLMPAALGGDDAQANAVPQS